MKIPELLAPAGSFETLKAVCLAGADAVYVGGDKFSARAYAKNFSLEELLLAIDYVHLHNKKLYLTLNILIKNNEIEEIYDYLRPLYERGLDAIIIQDSGAFSYIKEQFPKLDIHISTQAAVMSTEAALFYKNLGAKRIVTARELSLKELNIIKNNVDIELEVFVHGALCYSYSGLCLYSSLIGDRSGNRGRCAQPCRLQYNISGQKRDWLSLKDLSTLKFLPQMCEAGIDSLKIEGRMKSTDYAAGVTSIYRKYLDIIKKDVEQYSVDKEDITFLERLYQRRGFSEGYFFRHNGKEMLIHEGDEFNDKDIVSKERYIYDDSKNKLPVNINLTMKIGRPAELSIYDCFSDTVTCFGNICEQSKGKPVDSVVLKEKLNKLGDFSLIPSKINIDLDKNVFYPMSALNSLKRMTAETYINSKLEKYFRKSNKRISIKKEKNISNKNKFGISASVLFYIQAKEILKYDFIDRVYIDYDDYYKNLQKYNELIRKYTGKGKQVFLALPYVFREKDISDFHVNSVSILKLFNGLLIRNIDELAYFSRLFTSMILISDFTIYSYNSCADAFFNRYIDEKTAPIELNYNELKNLSLSNSEQVVYGRYPMMQSANCLFKNSRKCTNNSDFLEYTDRMGYKFFVKSNCLNCYNTIYNSKILSLFGVMNKVKSLTPNRIRLAFTNESVSDINNVFKKFQPNIDNYSDIDDFTRGHFTRGVL